MYLHRSLPLALVLAAAVGSLATAEPVHNAPPKITYKTAPPPGIAPTSYTAVVNKNGDLVRGVGATAASRPRGQGHGRGRFHQRRVGLRLRRDRRRAGQRRLPARVFITVVGRSGTPQGIFVETYAHNGKLTNLPFHIDVGC